MTVDATTRDIGELTPGETFGIARRRVRVEQKELAARTGVAQPLISGWEIWGSRLSDENVSRLWRALDEMIREREQ